MNKNIRKAFVAVAALLAIATVPLAANSGDQAGGFGDWPMSQTNR